MSKLSILIVVALLGTFFISIYAFSSSSEKSVPLPLKSSIYEYDVTDIDGNEVSLDKYKGNVLMIVNTASKCGYVSQYKDLQKVYEKHKKDGFVILGFPSNNFAGQEPGTNKEIKDFCTLRYKVTFPMFAKISVKGDDQAPIYNFLTNEKTNPDFAGDITWNFNKFLINKNGKIIARFSSQEVPESKEILKTIEKALTAKSN